jgi:hypothetical protein
MQATGIITYWCKTGGAIWMHNDGGRAVFTHADLIDISPGRRPTVRFEYATPGGKMIAKNVRPE